MNADRVDSLTGEGSHSKPDPGTVTWAGLLAILIVPPGFLLLPATFLLLVPPIFYSVATLFSLSILLLAVALAHWSWWTCSTNYHVRGFGWAMAAMIVTHTFFALWLIAAGAIIGGLTGILGACAVTAGLFMGVAIAMRSAAAKYSMMGAFGLFIAISLIVCFVLSARESARRNDVMNNIRKIGVDWQWAESIKKPADRHGFPRIDEP